MKTYENLFLVKKDWIRRRTEKQPFKVAFDPFVWGSIILRFFFSNNDFNEKHRLFRNGSYIVLTVKEESAMTKHRKSTLFLKNVIN